MKNSKHLLKYSYLDNRKTCIRMEVNFFSISRKCLFDYICVTFDIYIFILQIYLYENSNQRCKRFSRKAIENESISANFRKCNNLLVIYCRKSTMALFL